MATTFESISPAVQALASRHCRAGAPRLGDDEVKKQLAALTGWRNAGGRLEKTFLFANFHETVGFVNALAWIANREDHHPDLVVSYSRCVVTWSTHDAGGLTENDVVCAARTDRLLA